MFQYSQIACHEISTFYDNVWNFIQLIAQVKGDLRFSYWINLLDNILGDFEVHDNDFHGTFKYGLHYNILSKVDNHCIRTLKDVNLDKEKYFQIVEDTRTNLTTLIRCEKYLDLIYEILSNLVVQFDEFSLSSVEDEIERLTLVLLKVQALFLLCQEITDQNYLIDVIIELKEKVRSRFTDETLIQYVLENDSVRETIAIYESFYQSGESFANIEIICFRDLLQILFLIFSEFKRIS